MKIFIYNNFNFYNKFNESMFKECVKIEKYFFNLLINETFIVSSLENADIAFIPITPASHIYELGIDAFKKHYNEFIKHINLDSNIQHFIIYPYTFYDKEYNNISFIDKRIYILSLENEISNFDFSENMRKLDPKIARSYNSITIPYHLNQNSHLVCKGVKNVINSYFDTNDNYNYEQRKLFSYIGMPSSEDENINNRSLRIFLYREYPLNNIIKKYGKENIIIGRPDKDDPYSLYEKSIFALIFRGDGMTRAGFYQALFAGCIPIIFNDCFLDYQNFLGYKYDLSDIVITIPFYDSIISETFKDLKKNYIWNLLDSYINNKDLILKKINNIKNILPNIDYNNIIETLPAPVYHSINSIILYKSFKKPYELIYFYFSNSDILNELTNDDNCLLSNNEEDILSEEYIICNKLFKNVYKTYDIEKSDYIFIPVYYMKNFMNELKNIKIYENKIYIIVFNNIINSDSLQFLSKFPKKSICIFLKETNLIIEKGKNDLIILDNTRLLYNGSKCEMSLKLLNNVYSYGSMNSLDVCLELIKNNPSCKQIVYNKITKATFAMNELIINENSDLYDIEWTSICNYDEYIDKIKSQFIIYETLYPKKIYYPYLFNRYY